MEAAELKRQLIETCRQAEAEFAGWVGEQTRSVESDQAQFAKLSLENKENESKAKKALADLEQQHLAKDKAVKALAAKKDALAAEVGDLTAEHEARADALQHERDRIAALQTEKANLRAEIGTLRKGSAAAAKAKTALVQTYEEHLGLRFERKRDESLKFIFTKIDEANLAREFSFTMKIDQDGSDRRYAVTKCRPEVPNLPLLVSVLNETNDLGAFVRQMRDKFAEQC